MREFFKSWRRKAGCITLVMACIVTGAWIRSYTTADFVTWVGGDGLSGLNSGGGLVEYNRQKLVSGSLEPSFPKRSGWDSLPITADGLSELLAIFEDDVKRCDKNFEFLGMVFGDRKHDGTIGQLKVFIIVSPYRNIAVALTLLSACLLLWRPRKRTGADHG